jgi:SAM-dependent methyltransferase
LTRHGFRLVSDYRDYSSETSKCRERLAPFCVGYGADIGFGGGPIVEAAIRIDYPKPYAQTGMYSVQLGGDATRLHWFADGVLDYIYSSHLLEDFADTKAVLAEWLRVLEPAGRLILYCSDQRDYEAYCVSRGLSPNLHHAHADFSLRKVQKILADMEAPRRFTPVTSSTIILGRSLSKSRRRGQPEFFLRAVNLPFGFY